MIFEEEVEIVSKTIEIELNLKSTQARINSRLMDSYVLKSKIWDKISLRAVRNGLLLKNAFF